MSEKVDTRKKDANRQDLHGEVENILIGKRLKEGKKFFEEGRYVEAIEKFSYVLGMEDNDIARQYLGRCYYRLDKYQMAYNHFEYLSKNSSAEMRDYGTSMVASVEILWGNYGKAIKILKALPKNTNNTINLAIVYWKKYKTENDEFSIREAMRLLDKLDIHNIDEYFVKKMYHLKALIYQAQKEHRLAKGYYKRALKLAANDVEEGRILNDYSSLLIELKEYPEAKEILEKAWSLVEKKNKTEEAFNNKWKGIIALVERDYESAKKYLDEAAKVLKDKDMIADLACIDFILANITRDEDFYKAAQYFADGRYFEDMYEEMEDRDEKVLELYLDSFKNNQS